MLAAALVTQPVTIFLIVLGIILCAPLLLNKLKIPHIIGMIVAGVLVGPYGFNIIAKDSTFDLFGQVGLLYLMFLAGLEIDMYHLKLNLKRGLVFGLLTLAIPLVMGVASSVWILHLNWLTALMLGAMYASHTLIAYPVATRLGISKSPAVLISIVGTIIAVVGALLVLAATVSVRREGALNSMALLRLLVMMILYGIGVLYFYPRLTRIFFKHVNDKVTQYVYILTMVFLAAWIAQVIGLEGVLGAFFAGLVLNRYVPAGSSLMSSIEFVGNALFIPFFLISVGMMINARVILEHGTLAVTAIMLVVALVSKWLPAWIAQKANGLSAASRTVMFGLTTAHTAVALAVATLGFNLGMLDEQVLNSTILVILVTCAIAPIVTSGAAAKLKVEMLDSEDGTGDNLIKRTRHNNTLISVGSPLLAPPLIELAVLMRNDRGRHNFYAIHVRNENGNTARAVSRNALEEAAKAGAAADTKIETLDRFDVNVVTGLVNAINERDITEVIVGMHRRNAIIDSFFGNNISQLLKATNKMVIITRCFIPLNTLTRIMVWVPPKAQYETGFGRWVRNLARLTHQVGCRIIFCCTSECQPLIRGVIYQGNYGIRCEFETVEQWDDFIILSNKVLIDDLLVVVAARVNSVSYTGDMIEMPQFLQRYFAQNNLLVLYPEQFGEAAQSIESFADPNRSDVQTAPSPLWLKAKAVWRKIVK
ncbi:MAG: cation:proton antiporter [Bacteroidales bacterium]|nr:cation:proton antiporter [Bacteroidales bacterium]